MVARPCDGIGGRLWDRRWHILNRPGSDGEGHGSGRRRNLLEKPSRRAYAHS